MRDIVYVETRPGVMEAEEKVKADKERRRSRKEWLEAKLTTWWWSIWAVLFIALIQGLEHLR